jgi:uncharacterized membrane protein YoaK (UPF0700 family)
MTPPGDRTALRNALLLLLTNAAGYVDALSYLALGRVFTANMTGNTVLLGLGVIQADGEATLRAGLALLGFLAGGALGAWVVQRVPHQAVWPRGVTIALGLEWLLLAAMALVALPLPPTPDPGTEAPGRASLVAALIVVSALAMGVQSAAARRLDVSGVATTFITGTLTTLTTMIATVPPQVTRGRRLLLAVWLLYVVGAMLGTAVVLNAPHLAFAAPVALLLPVIIAATAGFWR